MDSQKTKIETWNYDQATKDPALITEDERRHASQEALNKFGNALAKDAYDNANYKDELEQTGKWPGTRWYSGTAQGYDPRKAIADFLFLSLFGHSDHTEDGKKNWPRAVKRIVITIVVVVALDIGWNYITKIPGS